MGRFPPHILNYDRTIGMSNQKEISTGKRIARLILSKNELGAVIPLLGLCLIVVFINPKFFGLENFLDILRTTSFTILIGVALTFLMTAGGMDLSVGSTLSMAGVIAAYCSRIGLPLPLCILIPLLAGACVGAFNGFAIVKMDQPPFITTMAVDYIVKGAVVLATKGNTVTGVTKSFKRLGQYRLFGLIPIPILYGLIFVIIGYIILNKTKLGRAIAAIGGNPETAHLAGIDVIKIRFLIFVAVSVSASLCGVIYAARFSSGIVSAGDGYNLKIMGAVIIGGTSHKGGNGTILGTLLGCLLMAVITNFLVMCGVSTQAQQLIFGIILVIAIFIDKYRRSMLSGGLG